MHATTQIIKLPVLATVRQSWASVARNPGLALRLIWPWLAVFLVCILATIVGILVNSGTATPSPSLSIGAAAVPGLVIFLAFMLAIPAVAVGWHRAMLSGERPETPIRIDGRVWGYIGYSLLLALIAGLVNLLVLGIVASVAGISVGVGDGPMSLERLAALAPFLPIAFIPTLLVLNRFLLVLPAIAIDRRIGFGEALRLTRGNTLRLTITAGLVSLPIVLVQGLGQLAALYSQAPALIGFIGLMNLAVLVYCSFASLSFLSLSLKTLALEPTEIDEPELDAAYAV